MEERNAALRAELHAAREAGDISLGEYLSELRKLRECGAPASGADEASSATAHSKAARAFAPAEAGDGASSSDDDDLIHRLVLCNRNLQTTTEAFLMMMAQKLKSNSSLHEQA